MDIDKLVELANSLEIIKATEPNVCFHLKIEKWMVARILEAQRRLKKK